MPSLGTPSHRSQPEQSRWTSRPFPRRDFRRGLRTHRPPTCPQTGNWTNRSPETGKKPGSETSFTPSWQVTGSLRQSPAQTIPGFGVENESGETYPPTLFLSTSPASTPVNSPSRIAAWPFTKTWTIPSAS